MTTFDSYFDIFDKIPIKKIPQLFGILDESVLIDDIVHCGIYEIVKDDINNAEVKKLLFVCSYIVTRAIHPDEIINRIDHIPLDDIRKTLLKQEIRKLYDKINIDEIKLNLQTSTIERFGHPHVHEFMFATEFRPISKSSKIIKLVPSLVVAGTIHNNDLESRESINFQLDLKQADKLVHDLNIAITSLNDEIKNMRDKFGGDIID